MTRRAKTVIKSIFAKTISIILLAIGAIVLVFPFMWAISSSLQGRGMAFTYPPTFFQPPFIWENYATALLDLDFFNYAKNSFILTGIACVAHPLSSSLAAFGIAKYDNWGTKFTDGVIVTLLVMPVVASSVPLYVMWMNLGFLDTYVPILFKYFFGTVFAIYLIRQTFKSLPGDFYDAGLIDGCNPFTIYYKIYLPLAKAIMATVVLQTFMGEWNDMMQPLIYLTTKSKYNLALGLLYVKGNYTHRQEVLMASSVVMMVPSIVIYACLQKFFVQGVAAAGVKG